MLIAVFFLIFTTALVQAGEEQNKQWVSQFYTQVLNTGNINLIDSLVAEDYQDHEPLPGYESNRDGLKSFFKMMRKAFPDLHNNVEYMVAEGDKVVSYITMTGTHKGDYMGAAGNGKSFTINVIDIIKVVNGKMTEHWGVGDYMTMMGQLASDTE